MDPTSGNLSNANPPSGVLNTTTPTNFNPNYLAPHSEPIPISTSPNFSVVANLQVDSQSLSHQPTYGSSDVSLSIPSTPGSRDSLTIPFTPQSGQSTPIVGSPATAPSWLSVQYQLQSPLSSNPSTFQANNTQTFTYLLHSTYDIKEDESGYKGTILAYIVRSMFVEFREQARKRIEKVMSFSMEEAIPLFSFENDTAFRSMLLSFGEISKHCLSVVIRALMNWRVNQLSLDISNILSASMKAKIKKPNILVLEERYQLIVDFIFCTCVASLLANLTRDNLDETVTSQLETICFEHFKPRNSKLPEYAIENRKQITDLYSSILGTLSKYRFKFISTTFFKEVNPLLASNAMKAGGLIQGIRLIKLKIKTKRGLEAACEFLSNYLQLFKAASRTEVKQWLAETIVSMFKILIDTTLTSDTSKVNNAISYTEWYALLKKFYDVTEPRKARRSKKDMQLYYPLMTTILCLTDREFFLNNWGFVDTLLKGLPKLKDIGLDLIHLMVEVYLQRFPEPTDEKLLSLTQQFFPNRKSIIITQHDCLEIFADLICTIARTKLDFAMNNIVFDLLKGDTLVPERMIIGLRALITISNMIDYDTKNRSARTLSTLRPSKNRNVPLGGTLTKAIETYISNINIFVSHILTTLDQVFGSLLLSTQSKNLNELITRLPNGYTGIELLTITLSCIPFVFPVKCTNAELINMLSRYLIHADEGIREVASETLSRLMFSRPDLRHAVILGISSFVLTIADERSSLIYLVLSKINQLLFQWKEVHMKEEINKHDSSTSEPKPDDTKEKRYIAHKIEAVALVFLCCPYTKIRKLCFEILYAIRAVDRVNREREYESGELRLMDMIEESGKDVIYRLQQDSRYRFPIEHEASIELLATNSKGSSDTQTRWTCCLAELLKFFLSFAPEPIRVSWDMVCARIAGVVPDESARDNDARLIWWRNYIVFACATVTCNTEPLHDQRKRTGPSNARELFSTIIPHLKSSVDAYRQTAAMALEKTNPAVYEIFFDAMKPCELEFSKKGKTSFKRKDRNRLRSVVTLIYSSIAENMKSGTLRNSDILRKTFVGFIQETLQFLLQPLNEFIWDNLQFVRYNFCVMVGAVAQELQTMEDYFDKGLRRELFVLLMKWSKGEELLSEEQNKKKLNAILAQMKEHEKAPYERMITEQTIVLQHSACMSISYLLLGSCWDNSLTDPNSPTFTWINNLLQRNEKLRRIGRSALHSFLQGNLHHPEFMKTVINQCYSTNMPVAKGYFLALVDLYKDKDFRCPIQVLLNLILFKVGDKSSIIRKHAIQLLQLISTSQDNHSTVESEEDSDEESDEELDNYETPLSIESSLHDTYQRTQLRLSSRLAEDHSHLAYDIFNDVVKRLDVLQESAQKQVLTYIIPWIQKMNFSELKHYKLKKVLQNFFLITLKYGDVHPYHIEYVWTTLGEKYNNVSPLIKFLLEVGFKKQNPNFVPLAKRISMYIGRVSAQATVDALVTELSSVNPDAKSDADILEAKDDNAKEETTILDSQFDTMMPQSSYSSHIGRGHFAQIILAELSYEIGEEFRPHLPIILQLVFLGFDSPQPPVFEHSRILLLNLIHSLVVESDSDLSVDVQREALDLEDLLKSKEGKPLWANEDVNMGRTEIPSANELTTLATRVCTVLSQTPDLNERWADEALTWAISCPSPHLISRSYQIYRALRCTISREALIDVLRALAKCISHPSEYENIGLALEILYTLQVMVQELDSHKLILFTQVFWGAVAMLHTDYEQHFAEAVKLLSKLIARLDFKERSVQNVFLASIPAWNDPPFEGVQPLVLKGLYSSATASHSITLLSQLTLLPCDEIFHPHPCRFIANMMGLLPWLCLNIKQSPGHGCFTIADVLSQACMIQGQAKLAKCFHKFSTGSYENLAAFYLDIRKPLKEVIIPKHSVFVFTLLFSLLDAGPIYYHQIALQLATHLLSVSIDACMESNVFRNKIPQWFGSVVRLTNGPLAADAIQLINTCIRQIDLNTISFDFAATSSSLYLLHNLYQAEFLNKPKQGTTHAIIALQKVLEACKYSTDRGSISHVISPTFWSKFFSNDIKLSASTRPDIISIKLEDDDHDVKSKLRYIMGEQNKFYDDDTDEEVEDTQPKGQLKETPSEEKLFRLTNQQFAHFPSFQGFEDILDFSEFEKEEENEDQNHNHSNNSSSHNSVQSEDGNQAT